MKIFLSKSEFIVLTAKSMKKNLFLLCLMILSISCIKEKNMGSKTSPQDIDVNHFITSESYEVPVREGHVTVVKCSGVTIAEANTPMTIWVPKQSRAKTGSISTSFVPDNQYPNFTENKSQMFQVICFEDSKNADYDYNDLVIHVRYQTKGSIFAFGVQPVALGSTKPIKLGCVVYKGEKQVFKGLITPVGADCRSQYFKSQEGFINTVGTTSNQKGEKNGYLGSTIRNWDISKMEGSGLMRVEWYIEVDGGTELYAISTDYLSQSFDKNGLPYGLVITTTGSEYTAEEGYVCGYDWFNYPKEAKHIKDVYPEIWVWLTTDSVYDFASIYDGHNPPRNAFPASDLGLFEAKSFDMTDEKYRVK